MICPHRERSRCQGDRGIPEPAHFAGEDMPRKPLDKRLTDYPFAWERHPVPFPASGEDGCGQSPQVKFRAGDAQRRGRPFQSVSPRANKRLQISKAPGETWG